MTTLLRPAFGLIALLTVNSIHAQEYQHFGDIVGQKTRFKGLGLGDANTVSANYTYYFQPLPALGPLDQFQYIINESSLSVSTVRQSADWSSDTEWASFAGGEYNGEHWQAGGSLRLHDSFGDGIELFGGYQFHDDLQALVYLNGSRSNLQFDRVEVNYNIPLKGTEFLGLTGAVGQNQLVSIEATWFTQLDNAWWLRLDAGLQNIEGYRAYQAAAKLNFTVATSVSLSYYDVSEAFPGYGISGRHFFTDNIALDLSYATRDGSFFGELDDTGNPIYDEYSERNYYASLVLQF